jgi:CheY-like chemotaxis protein
VGTYPDKDQQTSSIGTTSTVVIADDEQGVREVLTILLESSGFDVVGLARDGLQALSLSAQHHPDFVILDWRMPVMDGEHAADGIRLLDRDIQVVAMSAMLGEKPPWADAFLTKWEMMELPVLLRKLASTA